MLALRPQDQIDSHRPRRSQHQPGVGIWISRLGRELSDRDKSITPSLLRSLHFAHADSFRHRGWLSVSGDATRTHYGQERSTSRIKADLRFEHFRRKHT